MVCPFIRCTKEQSAFLSSSRAARFSSSQENHVATATATTTTTGATVAEEAEAGLGTPKFSPVPPSASSMSANNINEGTRAGFGWSMEGLGYTVAGPQGVGGGGAGAHGLAALGVGLSGTVLEELDKIERACSQRSSALKEEEPFVETLGRLDSPVAA